MPYSALRALYNFSEPCIVEHALTTKIMCSSDKQKPPFLAVIKLVWGTVLSLQEFPQQEKAEEDIQVEGRYIVCGTWCRFLVKGYMCMLEAG